MCSVFKFQYIWNCARTMSQTLNCHLDCLVFGVCFFHFFHWHFDIGLNNRQKIEKWYEPIGHYLIISIKKHFCEKPSSLCSISTNCYKIEKRKLEAFASGFRFINKMNWNKALTPKRYINLTICITGISQLSVCRLIVCHSFIKNDSTK